MEVGLSGPTWAEGLAYGGRLEIGREGGNQKTSSVSESDTGTHASTPPLRRRPCFLKSPQQSLLPTQALHATNTEIFKASTLGRNSELMQPQSPLCLLRRLVSPRTLLPSKLVALPTYRISGRAAALPPQQLTFAVRLLSKCQALHVIRENKEAHK